MAKNKNNVSFEKALGDLRTVSYVFLGVGLLLFILNLSAMLSFLPDKYSYLAFNISVFLSMIMVIVAVYFLHDEK